MGGKSSRTARDAEAVFTYIEQMTTHLQWPEILLRLGLTVVAGTLVGVNRGEHGHPAGLRTTLLVCLAASLSMIQVNLLLDMDGRPANSFVMLDLMRLPLGILSGMGFIGAGAIVRKGDMVIGVTTAATLWFVTVMGLCFGGGQVILGLVALGLAVLILSGLKELERRVKQDFRGIVTLKLANAGPTDSEVTEKFEGNGFRIASWRVTYSRESQTRELNFRVRWRRVANDLQAPPLIAELARAPGVLEVGWSD